MKKTILTLIIFSLSVIKIFGQPEDDHSAIRLYLDPNNISQENGSLETNQQDRLYRKITQLINQTGVVEIGYSTFFVTPTLEVISNSESRTGIASVFLAECELNLSIKRAAFGTFGEATFNTFSKNINGSGSSQKEAINNALSNLSPNDKDIVDFFNKSKQKINAYFQTHCNDVIKEAQQALDLKEYAKSIALYFSVPFNAPCYKTALEKSKGAYITYIDDECNKKLVMLNSYVALSLTENRNTKNYYDSAMNIMRSLSPASDKCYAEAKKQIDKIENRLTSQQKEEWDVRKKLSLASPEVQKEMFKAMGKISTTYQPASPSTKIIIAH